MALCGSTLPHQRQQQLLMTAAHNTYQRAIAPAPLPRGAFPANTRCASYPPTSSSYSKSMKTPTTLLESANNPSIIRRNARERNRVKQVNNGFSNLRQHLPPAIVADLSNGRRGIGPGAHKKLSKVDTLRMAVEYIRRLQRVIDEVDGKRAPAATQHSWQAQLSPATSISSITSSTPTTPSPDPHAVTNASALFDKMQQHFYYGGNFDQLTAIAEQQQPQQQIIQHSALISPASSIGSGTSYEYGELTSYNAASDSLPLQFKHEYAHNFDEHESSSGDEEDILDYITLWQEDL